MHAFLTKRQGGLSERNRYSTSLTRPEADLNTMIGSYYYLMLFIADTGTGLS